MNRHGNNGAEFEGGWAVAKFAALAKWIDVHPEKLKMSRAGFDQLLKDGAPRPAQK